MALEPAMILFCDNETEEYSWEDILPSKPAGDGQLKWRYSLILSAVMTLFARVNQISLQRWNEGQKKQEGGVKLATPEMIKEISDGMNRRRDRLRE
jgi:hypothetical protein